MSKQSKTKLIVAAADLLRRRGLQATSIRELARHAEAPLGSVYHYFPDGKAEFVQEAIAYAAEKVMSQLTECLALGPVEGFRLYFAQWRKQLTESGFSAGCPLAAIAMDSQAKQDAPAALALAAQTLKMVETQITASLCSAGIPADRARKLGVVIIALTEGAILMSRAQANLNPINTVDQSVSELLTRELRLYG